MGLSGIRPTTALRPTGRSCFRQPHFERACLATQLRSHMLWFGRSTCTQQCKNTREDPPASQAYQIAAVFSKSHAQPLFF